MVMNRPVLVVGRGIAGLAMGFALASRRIPVRVIGQSSGAAATTAAVGLSSIKGQYHAQKPLFAAKVAGHAMLWDWLNAVESAAGSSIPRFQALAYEPYWSVTEYERIRERVFHRAFSGHTGAVMGLLPDTIQARFKAAPLGAAVYDGEIWYDPRAALSVLEVAIRNLGGDVVDGIVERIESSDGEVALICGQDRYESPHCVLAAGYHTNDVLEASRIKAPKQTGVFGETLLFDNLPRSFPQIIHMDKTHLVVSEGRLLFGSSSISLEAMGKVPPTLSAATGGYVDNTHNAALRLDGRLSSEALNNKFSTVLSGIRGRYQDIAPCIDLLKLPESENKILLFSGFYKSGLQLAPFFAEKLASSFASLNVFLPDPKFSFARFSSHT